ncbi:Rne/Rng family ribonuclease [Devosia rhodophyticola]|uniref:Ribonuclease E n=1 Tax=Devosia rhodophyticola TaxID=3026423 RepID=A0ABY7YWT0_9HYPH|nr:Rne/Rng family ribonuclease [Devosia rhodophyticola]WDR05662.1 Rne/Rng family ribonuclease [Devosia rhodophyticola]
MATKRMLVDAIHPEETRIVVTSGNRLEEFDFESAQRRQLRGNIYLAKVTRVEPSLQAAFVEYGGNRHGFLAFSEIHPDYYQIPVADREALLRDEEDDHKQDDADDHVSLPEGVTEPDAETDTQDMEGTGHIEEAPADSEPVESIGGADALEEVPERRRSVTKRHYKIQEVIKRRQVMLVQVVKEERGNKGAALTSYLSLAGRYSVLMPNTARGGGISRKITNAADRKRLKEITSDLEVPQGMGVILRTAGASRTKAEVKRDFEYLMRLWENVRSLTLKSQAPCLVYEEGSLIKRTIRDLYNKDIDEVFVAGDDAYREAKDFMRMIMPSHAKNVQLYKDDQPLFSKYTIEQQLDSMFSPQVTLPSGGYLVINPTEALVSIDVNSGRSTKEHNIEDTALQTNLEAADEVARQLRLRDLAGLVVIDFIDMVENRSNRAVERRLKEALKDDRARIQVGRISHFGLMEMSRQRIRFGVVESSTHKCPICDGTGLVRSVESLALMVMRNVEDHVLRRPGQSINVRVPVDVALYILNFKRDSLTALEDKYQLSITVTADGKLTGSQFGIEKGEARANAHLEQRAAQHVRVDSAVIDDDAADQAAADEAEAEEETPAAEAGDGETGRSGRRRRRRRRGGERNDENGRQGATQPAVTQAEASTDDEAAPADSAENGEEPAADGDDDGPRKRRRRGRRGGRRNRRDEEGAEISATAGEQADAAPAETPAPEVAQVEQPADVAETPAVVSEAAPADVPAAEAPGDAEVAAAAEKPKKVRRPRKTAAQKAAEAADAAAATAVEGAAPEAEPAPEKPKRKPRVRKPKVTAETEVAAAEATPMPTVEAPAEKPAPEPVDAVAAEAEAAPVDDKPRRARKELPADGIVVSSSSAAAEAEGASEPEKKKKGGWWQRRLGLG